MHAVLLSRTFTNMHPLRVRPTNRSVDHHNISHDRQAVMYSSSMIRSFAARRRRSLFSWRERRALRTSSSAQRRRPFVSPTSTVRPVDRWTREDDSTRALSREPCSVFCFPLLHSMKYAYRGLLVVAYQSYLMILARKRSPPIPTHPPVVFTMLIH